MRKQIALGALALTAAVVLAGCAGGGSSDNSDDAADSSAELVVWTDEERQTAVKDAAKAFEEETGATVKIVKKNFEDLRNDFIAQVPTGEGPDITVGAHDWLGALVAAGVVDTIDLGDKASEFEPVALEAGNHVLEVTIPQLPLQPGSYRVSFALFNGGNNLTGGTVVDSWFGVPLLTLDVAPLAHAQDEWAGVLNVPATFAVRGVDTRAPAAAMSVQ